MSVMFQTRFADTSDPQFVVQDVQVHRLLVHQKDAVEYVFYTVQVGALNNATQDPPIWCYKPLRSQNASSSCIGHAGGWVVGVTSSM